jgi:cell division protease FtsH
LWLLVIFAGLTLFQVMNNQRNPTQEFSYTEFTKQLESGNVANVTVFDGKRLEGDFRTPVVQNERQAKRFTVLLPIADSEEFLTRLEESGIPITAREPRSGITTLLITALPWVVIFGLWVFLLRQMQAGGSRAFSFGKSKAKLLTGDTPKVTFADVAGADEAKVELQEIISAQVHPPRRALAQRRVVGRAAGDREDPVGQGSRGRGRPAVLLDVRVGLCRDVRRRWREPRPRPVRTRENPRPLHHLHR